MIYVFTKIFGQSDVVLRDLMLEMSGLLEVLTSSDLLKFLIYTEEVWFQLWVFLKKQKIINKGIS